MANRITRTQAFQAVDFLRHRANNGVEPVSKSTLLQEVSGHLGVRLTDGNLKGILDDAKEMGIDTSKLVKSHDRQPFAAIVFNRLDLLNEQVQELEERLERLESELS